MEPCPGATVVVTLFEVECTPESVAQFIEREHEFKFMAVTARTLQGTATGRNAVRNALFKATVAHNFGS
jgi:hypothetical protein